MMKRLIPILLCLALLLCACGSSMDKSEMAYEMDRGVAETAVAPMAAPMAANGTAEEGAASVELPQGRKFIIRMHMSAETDDLDAAVGMVNENLARVQGYVESQNIYNGSSYSNRRYRSADLTLRIPVENLDDFTQAVEGCTNVVSTSRNTEDVTLQYVDTEGRVKALQTEQQRLLELLSQADNMSDLLEIESRLADVRGELERYTSQLKVLENQVDYATLNLEISEVKEYTPVAEKTRLEKIAEGFVRSIRDLGSGILDFFVWLLIDLPYLAVIGLFLFAGGKLFGKAWKKIKAKKQEKTEKQEK